MTTTRALSNESSGNYESQPSRPGLPRRTTNGFYDELRIGPCLLISRQMGSGGSQIASKVAARLGWSHLDKEIIDKLITEYGTPRVVLDAVDEKKSGMA